MLSLTEFLLARIAEDERHARKLAESDSRPVLALAVTVNHPQRLLAECEAKRRIVGMCLPNYDEDGEPVYNGGGYAEAYLDALMFLAAVYADHDDYDETWRP